MCFTKNNVYMYVYCGNHLWKAFTGFKATLDRSNNQHKYWKI